MAGSFDHILAEDGTFTMDFIENMGDAHEALLQCFDIIRSLAPTPEVVAMAWMYGHLNPRRPGLNSEERHQMIVKYANRIRGRWDRRGGA